MKTKTRGRPPTGRADDSPRDALHGVVATLPELAGLRAAGRLLDLPAAAKVSTLMAGPYRSPFRGRGVEFDEVRAYQHGDDVRTIDWRVTARTGRPHTKLFHEERERPVLLLVDAGPSMRFGSRVAFKSVTAARAAALVAWGAEGQGDRVGGVVRGGDRLQVRRPARRRAAVLSLLDSVSSATTHGILDAIDVTEPEPTLGAALARLRRIASPGAKVVVISDFYDFDETARRHLDALARGGDLTVILVSDPLEETAPPPGSWRVSDGERVVAFDSSGRRQRERYAAHFLDRQADLTDFCARRRARLLGLRTDDDVVDVLTRAHRARRGHRPGRNTK